MKDTDRQTRTYLMELFAQHGFHPRSDLGQNFLIDLNLLDFVVREAEIGPLDVVLEVGTGTGSMTALLAESAAAVVSVELDRNVYELARQVVGDMPHVTLLNCDVLRNKNNFAPDVMRLIGEQLAAAPERTLKLVANLPYSVATPVVSNLMATDLPWSRMVITIQWELAERMAAAPGSSHYGALSVWLQSQSQVKLLKRLPPNVFWPRPRVESAIVRLVPDPVAAAQLPDRVFFKDFVRRLFHHRRKFLRGVLVGMYRKELNKSALDAILAESGHGTTVRAETLPVEAIVALACRVHRVLGASAGPEGSGDGEASDGF